MYIMHGKKSTTEQQQLTSLALMNMFHGIKTATP